MAKKFPLHPKHPERVCWGCDKYCPADAMMCGNGSSRTLHPAELLGDDWYTVGDWGFNEPTPAPPATSPAAPSAAPSATEAPVGTGAARPTPAPPLTA